MSDIKHEHSDATPVMGTGDAVGMGDGPEKTEYNHPSQSRYWFIARVLPNTEKSCHRKLLSLGYEAFVASQPELRFWKNGVRQKRKVVERVVITQFLFLHLSRHERERVIRYSFVREFMRNRASHDGRDFAILSDAEMSTLKGMFGQSERPVLFDTGDYSIGDSVLLHLGSFEYPAHVVRRRGDQTVYYGVRVGELGCAYMEVPPSALSRQ